MSTSNSQQTSTVPTESTTEEDDIWAVKTQDGRLGFRLADTTPPQAYDKLAVEFSEKSDELEQRVQTGRPVTVGTATLKRESTGCIEITSIESELENHTATWT